MAKSTRCIPGDIAVIIEPQNSGKLVIIVEAYKGQTISGKWWRMGGAKAWVIESLGCPFTAIDHDSKKTFHCGTAVLADMHLRPIRNGDKKDQTLSWKSKEVAK